MKSTEGTVADLTMKFTERMERFEADYLHKSPPDLAPGSALSMPPDYLEFKKFIFETLECLQRQLESYVTEVDALEMRNRRKILLIHGVPEQSKEDTASEVVGVVRDRLDLKTFTASAIRRCHRVGSQANTRNPRPILLKFRDVDVRDEVWHVKTRLKGSGITLSEFLTRTRHRVFMAARERFGVANCWTKRGYIYINGPKGKRHRIVSHGELHAIGEPAPVSERCLAPITEECPTAAPKQSPAAVAPKPSSTGPRRVRVASRNLFITKTL
ncbi:unnamed protein product [Spodoptera littoralis]|uniref:Uncharacterized protein n=1 Tax=Spodoptera littoralis TaxID=7109 RepID=A0A9P0IBG4_SPOLI|nr:unnamed protein product [Spodoptera littoralis]CAH1643660.1 unnamed protein product [Spodoptera littoralis]